MEMGQTGRRTDTVLMCKVSHCPSSVEVGHLIMHYTGIKLYPSLWMWCILWRPSLWM